MAKKTTSKAVATTGSRAVAGAGDNRPDYLRTKGPARGVSTAQEDNLIPLIYVLQAQSPQVLKKNQAYIQGAEAGDIWLRNASEPIIKGETGMEFQPCFFSKDWVEWIPRDDGGGYVGRHATLPEDAKRIEDKKNPKKVRFTSPRGTEYVETRYHVGNVIRGNKLIPFVIPLSSTGHNFSKQWMFMMNGHDGADSFARKYRLFTKGLSNQQGDWFGWDVEDLGWVDERTYKAGEALFTAFAQGAKTMEAPEHRETGATGDDDRM